jgi:hypothetical protein
VAEGRRVRGTALFEPLPLVHQLDQRPGAVSPRGIDVEVRRLADRQEVRIREDHRDGCRLPGALSRSGLVLRRRKPHDDLLASTQSETRPQSADGRPLRILVGLDLNSGLLDRLLDSAAGTPIEALTEKRVESFAVIRSSDFEPPLVERETHVALAAWLPGGISSHRVSYASRLI